MGKIVEVSVKLKRAFKVKFKFELAILYIICNMATPNINKMSMYDRKKQSPREVYLFYLLISIQLQIIF